MLFRNLPRRYPNTDVRVSPETTPTSAGVQPPRVACPRAPRLAGDKRRPARTRHCVPNALRRLVRKDAATLSVADGVGFEPTNRLHDCRISSPVHSTALPPIPGA